MAATHKIKQRDIVWAQLDPVVGREQGGRRPVVVISGNALNGAGDMMIICPLSTAIKSFAACPIIRKSRTNSLKEDSEALVFQLKAVSQRRVTKVLGEVTEDELGEIIEGVNTYLTY